MTTELPDNQRKEMLSDAYLQVVAAQAGLIISKLTPDFKKVDWKIESIAVHIPLAIQTKCTSDYRETDTHFVYELDADTYNVLCEYEAQVPAVLAVLFVPDRLIDRVSQSVEYLAVRNCMYRLFLGGQDKTTNTTSKTVYIPKDNVLSSSWLASVFSTMMEGGDLHGVL